MKKKPQQKQKKCKKNIKRTLMAVLFFKKEINMTIAEAINRCDTLKPNDFTESEKIEWLSRLDSRIKLEIIDTHEGFEDIEFEGYKEDMNLIEKPLLVPSPYDEMYLYWIQAQIDYNNGEINKYNNNISMFNSAYSDYAAYYNRTHMPLGRNYTYAFQVKKLETVEYEDKLTGEIMTRDNIVDNRVIYGKTYAEACSKNNINAAEYELVRKWTINKGFNFF
jgi:hypothetical protein